MAEKIYTVYESVEAAPSNLPEWYLDEHGYPTEDAYETYEVVYEIVADFPEDARYPRSPVKINEYDIDFGTPLRKALEEQCGVSWDSFADVRKSHMLIKDGKKTLYSGWA